MTPARWLAALLVGPLLALVALDRVIVSWEEQWSWAARELPGEPLTHYKAEALLRTWKPGEAEVLIVGNSRADAAFDPALLEGALAGAGPDGGALRVRKLTVGGSQPVSFGFRAGHVAALEPWVVILMTGASGLADDVDRFDTASYDVRALPALFEAAEVLRAPGRHLDGLAAQAHVLARHRGALQRIFLARAGWLRMEELQAFWRLAGLAPDFQDPWEAWVERRDHVDVLPNPNTRAIAHLARRVREGGGHLVVVESPTEFGVQALIGFGRIDRMREILTAMGEREGFVFLSGEDMPDIPPEHWADMLHLEPSGQRLYSEAIAPPLRRVLASLR